VKIESFPARESRREDVADLSALRPARQTDGLSAAEMALFERDGWIGSYPLLGRGEIAELLRARRGGPRFLRKGLERIAEDERVFDRRPWYKSMHAYLPAFGRLAAHPAIVARVASILGPDVIAWGMTSSNLRPRQRHRWHVDVEHRRWPGVSVFIALRNIAPGSSLKVVSGSHRIEETPPTGGPVSDAAALAASRRLQPASELDTVELGEGDFFIFHGRLWHGSHNRTWRIRSALIAQYARPDAEIAIPLTYDDPIRWHTYRPPCLLVQGTDRSGVNRLVPPPRDG
jgi:hypothetical protein